MNIVVKLRLTLFYTFQQEEILFILTQQKSKNIKYNIWYEKILQFNSKIFKVASNYYCKVDTICSNSNGPHLILHLDAPATDYTLALHISSSWLREAGMQKQAYKTRVVQPTLADNLAANIWSCSIHQKGSAQHTSYQNIPHTYYNFQTKG